LACLYIFCLLHSPKCYLGDVGTMMIRVVPRPCKVIICLLGV
jgi:hypothetical protein